jgi:tetratricopeptide (TPR) repeat protein
VLERQVAKALAGLTESPTSLTDDQFDESRDLSFICRTTNSNQVGFYHVARLKLHYYQGEYREALEEAEQALAAAGSFARQPAEVDLAFFRALAMLAIDDGVASNLEAIQYDRDRLAHWQTDCEANFAHKTRLVDAEIARVQGRPEALELYQQAIQTARADGFPHHAALASELAARHRIALGEDASELIRQAIDGYRTWGATPLADRLSRMEGPAPID